MFIKKKADLPLFFDEIKKIIENDVVFPIDDGWFQAYGGLAFYYDGKSTLIIDVTVMPSYYCIYGADISICKNFLATYGVKSNFFIKVKILEQRVFYRRVTEYTITFGSGCVRNIPRVNQKDRYPKIKSSVFSLMRAVDSKLNTLKKTESINLGSFAIS